MHIHYMNFHMYQKAKINSNNTSTIFILWIVLFNVIIISLRLGTYSVGTMLPYHAESPRLDPQHPIKWVWCGMCNPSTWEEEAGWSEGHPHHIVSSPPWATGEQTPKRKQCLQELEVIIKHLATHDTATHGEESAGHFLIYLKQAPMEPSRIT